MHRPDPSPSYPWTDAHVEAYLGNTLSPSERAHFEAQLRTSPHCHRPHQHDPRPRIAVHE
ncbi:MAG: hypothetical protein BRD35_03890 [Bacteroidetes bacterium QH_7_62_13]|nr:MAG: hypothetical protein BRD35_03890 [Bacteroidetes bacterium QH_7_62_13]